MNNPICISTGAVYKFSEDMNEKIQMLEKFSPDGVELCFADSQHLLDFKITEENLSYLRGLKAVSIHAPWKEIVYNDNELCHQVLCTIEKLYKQINANNVVVHFKTDSDVFVVNNYNFVTSAENGEWKTEKWPNTPEGISSILGLNNKLRFTFDFAHALTVSSDDVPGYINLFSQIISEIHFSTRQKDAPDHWFLHKHDSEEIRKLLSYLKPLNVSIALECVAADESELPLIKNEMEYARWIFG
jgi:hypothetical protein